MGTMTKSTHRGTHRRYPQIFLLLNRSNTYSTLDLFYAGSIVVIISVKITTISSDQTAAMTEDGLLDSISAGFQMQIKIKREKGGKGGGKREESNWPATTDRWVELN